MPCPQLLIELLSLHSDFRSVARTEFADMISAMMNSDAIYARTPPDCPLSADEQIEHLRTVASERGWTVDHVFSDRPTTVRKGQDRRPGELALIEAIRSGLSIRY